MKARLIPAIAALFIAATAAAVAGCGDDEETSDTIACSVGSPMVQTYLFFGRDRKDAAPVSDQEWQDFIDTVVTPLFKDGLTALDADGQYLSMSGELIKEDSSILILLHDGGAASSGDIEKIRESYRVQFDQESVLRVDEPICVSF